MDLAGVKVAFIGLGGMGAGMARNLLRTGCELVVYNRTRAKAESLQAAGAMLAESPRDAAAGAGVIISMVGDDDDSREVWLGEEGVLAGHVAAGAIAVECTTLSLEWVQELSYACTRAGLRYIDCPVTGGRAGAAAGALTLLIGTDERTLAEARPVLEAMSRQMIFFGPVGRATTYKLIVNLMVGVQAAALAEGLALAEKAGLDMEKVLAGLTSGAAASPVVKAYGPRMAAGEHDEPFQFVSRWVLKDLLYAGKLAAALDQPVPTLEASTRLFRQSIAELGPQKNVTAVIETLR